jgi:mono/diheme cytochrome c family protein
MSAAMRRLLSTALILSLTACASTPTPAVQTTPPPPVTTEPPTTTSVETADAGAPTATTPVEAADAGTAEATTTTTTPTTASTTPTTASTTPTTATTTHPATTPAGGGTVAQGRAVFQRVCARCHEDGEPDGPVPNLRWSEARMREMVRNGNRRMRAIPVTRLSDADLATLVVYLRSTHAIQ